MTKVLVFILFYTLTFAVSGQESLKSAHTIFFIGDAGEAEVLQAGYKDTLQHQLKHNTAPATVIFLGDNIYQHGMPPKKDPTRTEAESILKAQIKLIQDGSQNTPIYFIPGNHDWKQGRKEGLLHIKEQQKWFDSLDNVNIFMQPRNACPGPVEVSLSENLTLVIIDTQWLIHKWDKPGGSDNICEAKNLQNILSKFDEILQRNAGKRVIVAGHHPFITYGDHGGIFNLRQHIFPLTDLKGWLYIPLPLIGSLYPLHRKLIGDRQDIAHRNYKLMRCSLMKLFERFPGTIYASGHDHSLQYSVKDGVHYIVSGAGVKTTEVKKKGYAKFASAKVGFVKLTVYSNGEGKLSYFSTTPSGNSKLTYEIVIGQ